ncbi:39S ribosomal protein L46, mitochondrial [Papilio machaon]|uniref:Large ribosomal subunit protein mL46 n=1 Tax=Papilio machaon TaxID=76193 RepID=A0A194R061_PAPMA|nr:39S ribosomal protein L46, mitochondrial [Papilio machaon]
MIFKQLIRPQIKLCLRVFRKGLSTKPQWEIITGVCVERLPVVTPPLNDIQKKYKEFLWTIEVEKSLKSDHEIRHENDKIQAELLKSDSHDVDLDAVSKITAQDLEDAATEELSQFKFGSIETEADKKGDRTTTDRCLQRHLVLVAPVKWTAERVLEEHCGKDLKVQFLSNAPCGFYKYKYPQGSRTDDCIGAKVFFYYANYQGGAVDGKEKKFNWLTRNELKELLPPKYNKSVQEFLIEESWRLCGRWGAEAVECAVCAARVRRGEGAGAAEHGQVGSH